MMPSINHVRDLYSWAYAWDASGHHERPDLAKPAVMLELEGRPTAAHHEQHPAPTEQSSAMTDPRLQTLRDYLGMASGGTKTDAELWEFAEEALSDLAALNAESQYTTQT